MPHTSSALFRLLLLAVLLVNGVVLEGCRRIEEGTVPARKDLGPGSGFGQSTTPETRALITRGEELYRRYCVLCHGARGEGYAADNAPSLVSSTFLESASTDFLRNAIVRGRPGTAMAGYGQVVGGPLTDRDISALLAYLRRKAPPMVTLPSDVLSGDPARGKTLYERDCQSCHGTATQRSNAVHLANPVFLGTARPAFLRHAIVNGRPGTPMQAWGGVLEPREIDDLVAYVRNMATAAAPIPTQPTPSPLEVPPWGPIVQNPEGGHPSFTLREDRFVSIKQVHQALQEKKRIVIVDARAPSDWINLHIPGSLPLPYYDLSPVDQLPDDRTWIIAYCACPHHASGVVVDALRAKGIKTSAVLDEGVFAWQQAGYPVVSAKGASLPPAPPPMR